ncbi:unnamed protein product [Rotaria magnacalcarata]
MDTCGLSYNERENKTKITFLLIDDRRISIRYSTWHLIYEQHESRNADQLKLDIKSHRNLKRMTINVVDMILPWNDQVFDNYLCCVPNLEKSVIYRPIFISNVDELLLEYDCYSKPYHLLNQILKIFYVK